jgi:phosphohistidine phosphatase
MQRLLFICRHAETNDPFLLQPDFERELTPGGVHQAMQTGRWLREKFSKVDAILASPAKRTAATARLLADKLYFDEENIRYDAILYNAREAQLVQSLSELPDEVKSVLLVAHNPGVTRLARALTDKLIAYLEPAEAMAISLDLEHWVDIHYKTGIILNHSLDSTL